MTHLFEINSDGDETEEIKLNGKYLMTLNHDEHGWEGMDVARKLVEKIAKGIGATLIHGYIEDFDNADGDYYDNE